MLNKLFNFSKMVFYHLKENCTTKTHKFLMYPRFILMRIDHLEPSFLKNPEITIGSYE